MSTFTRADDLPARGCTRQNFYDMVENMTPDSDLVDDGTGNPTIAVSANDTLVAEVNVPRWNKYEIAFDDDDLDIAATTVGIVLRALPTGGIIHGVRIKHTEAFAATALTAATVEIGVSADTDMYCDPFDVFQVVADATFILNTVVYADDISATVGGTDIFAAVVLAGANCDALTAGNVEIWLLESVAG